jgi:hypothetical protein
MCYKPSQLNKYNHGVVHISVQCFAIISKTVNICLTAVEETGMHSYFIACYESKGSIVLQPLQDVHITWC